MESKSLNSRKEFGRVTLWEYFTKILPLFTTFVDYFQGIHLIKIGEKKVILHLKKTPIWLDVNILGKYFVEIAVKFSGDFVLAPHY